MKKRVLVGLSGGVDSAVSAYLLQQQGYEVSAGFMKNFAEPENPECHTRKDRNMAIKVAGSLGIKTFIITDFRKEYDDRIIKYIFEGYQQGITPNPDVFCNNLIKFDLFLKEAEKMGFDYIAMGHYARIQTNNGKFHLLRGVDHNKDQSYFLSRLNQYQLSKSLFPLGNLTKPEVREIAKKIGLPNAERKESQGLCFIGKRSMKEFLKRALPIKQGNIIDTDGSIVGQHEGAHFFTIGQSRGLDINIKAYVISTDTVANTVTVSYEKEHEYLNKQTLIASNWNRISGEPNLSHNYKVKIRYRQDPPVEAKLNNIGNDKIEITFQEKIWAITPGQIVVIYDKEQVLGSGIIK